MIEIKEAKKIIRDQVFPVTTFIKEIGDIARGDILAEDIRTPVDLPLFSNSMMDGYVVEGVHASYRIVGEIPAGSTEKLNIGAGEAYRIFTGAPVPENSFAVVMQEKALTSEGQVSFSETPLKGQNIRVRGDQVKKGETVLPAGTILTPGVVGFLANMGLEECAVVRKPQIALLTTGDECKPAGSALEFGQIYESNSVMLESALRDNGFSVSAKAHSGDSYAETKDQIENLLAAHDVLIVSGGISVGDHDHVGKCLTDLGVSQLIYKINQKPGKPFYLGRLADKIILALPGNPASTLTCLYLYGLPAIRRMAGTPEDRIYPAEVRMSLNHPHVKKGDRPEFARSHYHQVLGTVDILTKQRSSMLHSYALANCLVHLEAGNRDYEKNETVNGYLL